MSTADRNFTVKLTLAQANVVRSALEDRQRILKGTPTSRLSQAEREELLQLDALLRISF